MHLRTYCVFCTSVYFWDFQCLRMIRECLNSISLSMSRGSGLVRTRGGFSVEHAQTWWMLICERSTKTLNHRCGFQQPSFLAGALESVCRMDHLENTEIWVPWWNSSSRVSKWPQDCLHFLWRWPFSHQSVSLRGQWLWASETQYNRKDSDNCT